MRVKAARNGVLFLPHTRCYLSKLGRSNLFQDDRAEALTAGRPICQKSRFQSRSQNTANALVRPRDQVVAVLESSSMCACSSYLVLAVIWILYKKRWGVSKASLTFLHGLLFRKDAGKVSLFLVWGLLYSILDIYRLCSAISQCTKAYQSGYCCGV